MAGPVPGLRAMEHAADLAGLGGLDGLSEPPASVSIAPAKLALGAARPAAKVYSNRAPNQVRRMGHGHTVGVSNGK